MVDNRKKAIKKNKKLILETLKEYVHACRKLESKDADRLNEKLKGLYIIRNVLEGIPEPEIHRNEIPTYECSSIYLNDINDNLVDGIGVENICYCTGVENELTNTFVPTKILTPELAEQSLISARGTGASTKNLMLLLDKYEHTMILHCHSHPGTGPSSTHPSSVDIRCHSDLEKFYPVIGLIFSQDRYFRAFSVNRKFEIKIFGEGVEEHGNNIFRLQ